MLCSGSSPRGADVGDSGLGHSRGGRRGWCETFCGQTWQKVVAALIVVILVIVLLVKLLQNTSSSPCKAEPSSVLKMSACQRTTPLSCHGIIIGCRPI